MGFLDSLMGTSPEVKSRSNLSKSQQKLLSGMTGYYQPFTSGNVDVYGGDRVANLTPFQNDIYGQLDTLQGQYNPSTQSTPTTLANLLSGNTSLQQMLQGYVSGDYAKPSYLEDLYRTSTYDPMMESWKNDILPSLRGEYEQKGLYRSGGASGRPRAESSEAENLMDILGRTRAEFMTTGEDNAKARQLQAMGMDAGLIEMMLGGEERALERPNDLMAGNLANISTMLGLGELPRSINQSELDVQHQDWLRTQPGTRPQDQMIMALLGLDTMDTVVTPGSQGFLSDLLGAGAQYAGTETGAAGITSLMKMLPALFV